jgi:ribosomal protein L11 methyltransferase
MNFNNPHHLLPETILHIYYLKGVLSLHQGFPDGFIGNWEEDGFSFLFFLGPVDSFIDNLILKSDDLELVDHLTMTYGQWQGGSQAVVKAGSLTLVPASMELPPGALERTLRLDAGVVFGDGMHPTSLTCIKAMEQVCADEQINTMLDLGTGSGVLALAAVAFGCTRVVAVDNNLLAARTARRNVVLNDFEKQLVVVTGLAEEFTSLPADLLVANIHYEIMCRIIQTNGFLQKKRFILSGLLHREAEDIISLLSDKPVVILDRWQTGELWQTILGAVNQPAG